MSVLPPQQLEGTCVVSYQRSYKGFTDAGGREVAPGVTTVAWLVVAPDRDPIEVRGVPNVLTVGESYAIPVVEKNGRVRYAGEDR